MTRPDERRVLNPWERLQARVPSVFAAESRYTREKGSKATTAKRTLGISALSQKGEEAHMQREALRRSEACK